MAINFFRRNKGGAHQGEMRTLSHQTPEKPDISSHVEALRDMAHSKGYRPLRADDHEARNLSPQEQQKHPTTRNEWDHRASSHATAANHFADRAAGKDGSPYSTSHDHEHALNELGNHIKQGMEKSGHDWDRPSPFKRDHNGIMEGKPEHFTQREMAHKQIDDHIAAAKSKLYPNGKPAASTGGWDHVVNNTSHDSRHFNDSW